jgi:hypothetical protein
MKFTGIERRDEVLEVMRDHISAKQASDQGFQA